MARTARRCGQTRGRLSLAARILGSVEVRGIAGLDVVCRRTGRLPTRCCPASSSCDRSRPCTAMPSRSAFGGVARRSRLYPFMRQPLPWQRRECCSSRSWNGPGSEEWSRRSGPSAREARLAGSIGVQRLPPVVGRSRAAADARPLRRPGRSPARWGEGDGALPTRPTVAVARSEDVSSRFRQGSQPAPIGPSAPTNPPSSPTPRRRPAGRRRSGGGSASSPVRSSPAYPSLAPNIAPTDARGASTSVRAVPSGSIDLERPAARERLPVGAEDEQPAVADPEPGHDDAGPDAERVPAVRLVDLELRWPARDIAVRAVADRPARGGIDDQRRTRGQPVGAADRERRDCFGVPVGDPDAHRGAQIEAGGPSSAPMTQAPDREKPAGTISLASGNPGAGRSRGRRRRVADTSISLRRPADPPLDEQPAVVPLGDREPAAVGRPDDPAERRDPVALPPIPSDVARVAVSVPSADADRTATRATRGPGSARRSTAVRRAVGPSPTTRTRRRTPPGTWPSVRRRASRVPDEQIGVLRGRGRRRPGRRPRQPDVRRCPEDPARVAGSGGAMRPRASPHRGDGRPSGRRERRLGHGGPVRVRLLEHRHAQPGDGDRRRRQRSRSTTGPNAGARRPPARPGRPGPPAVARSPASVRPGAIRASRRRGRRR